MPIIVADTSMLRTSKPTHGQLEERSFAEAPCARAAAFSREKCPHCVRLEDVLRGVPGGGSLGGGAGAVLAA